MPSIFYIDPMNDKQIELDLADLVTLIKGSSITSMAHSDNYFELGLSDAFNLRIQAENGEADILLFSTLNKDEIPPVRLQLISDDQIPTAETLEKRIHSLRQLYATAFLIDAGRSGETARALAENPNIDLETLLEENDRLLVRSASTGSFWITLLTKTKVAFSTLSLIGPLFYDQGRQALLSRIRATTELKWLEIAQKSNDITFQSVDHLIELIQKIEKIKDPTVREKMHELLMGKMQEIGRGDLARLALPTPPSTLQAKPEGQAAPPALTGTFMTFALPKPSDKDET